MKAAAVQDENVTRAVILMRHSAAQRSHYHVSEQANCTLAST